MTKKKLKDKQPGNQPKQNKQPEKSKYFGLLGLVIIILLGIIIYSNSFDCPFQFDDKPNIVEKMVIRNVADVKAIWNASQTRFVPLYSFALNYHFGELNVWGYHLVNLLIHLINACLVYWLTLLIFSSPVLREGPIVKHKTASAVITGLLFVSHPLATQSVTYIVQRMASMAAMFYLLSLALYVKGRLTESPNSTKYLFFTGSFLVAVLALLSKENAITLPFAMVLVEVFFFQTKRPSINFKDYRVLLLIAGFLGFVLLLVFKFSFSILEPHLPGSHNDFRTITSLNYLLTQFGVIVKYIQLLILPVNLNLDYDWPLANSFLEVRTLLSFLLLLSLVLLAVLRFNKNRMLSFGIFWFLLTLSIESSIIPIDDLIFEHRTYLPSFGFFLILSSGIFALLWDKHKNLAMGILAAIILFNSYLTYERNKVWQDEFTLWSDVISKAPDKARGYNNRGNFFMNEKKNEEARNDFNKAIELESDYAEPYYNRGVIFEGEKRNDEANRDYSKAIELNPNYIQAYLNRGNVFMKEEKYQEALKDFNKAIELNSNFAKAYYNRGLLFMTEQKFDNAIDDFTKVISLNTDDVILAYVYYNRGMAKYFMSNKDDNGCMDLQEAAKLGYQPATDSFHKYCQ